MVSRVASPHTIRVDAAAVRNVMNRLLRGCAAWWMCGVVGMAADLAVSVTEVRDDANPVIVLDVAWKNAWHDDVNHDAAWIMLRHRGEPVPLSRIGASAAGGPVPARVEVSEDGVGVFVSPKEKYTGDVRWTVTLHTDVVLPDDPAELTATAVEMVYIPWGPFDLGDDDPAAREQGSFYASDGEGGAAGPYRVESRDEIPVGRDAGQLTYDVGEVPQYRGDQSGPIPRKFPRGTDAFYLMKYEVRQGEYAAFLNALPADLAQRRAFLARDGVEEQASGSIHRRDERFVADAPARPCNFLSWTDSCAFADWMGLRPMSELEFEKASRGRERPTRLDYPWGTADRTSLKRRVTETRDLTHASTDDERSLSRESLAEHGASYYRVFDLSGSLWERVVSIGHPIGRAFEGTPGDGKLDPETGEATNEDWPKASADGRKADGIGYRGGAEYFAEPSITNPYSPVGARTYAAWNDAYRYKTYSARACRTAPAKVTDRKLHVTLLANAGVELVVGDKRVLYDAFLRMPYAGYGALDDAAWARLLRRPADVVLATHVHADHLQVSPAVDYLARHRDALFVSSEQAVATLREEAGDRIDVDVRARGFHPQGTERERVIHRGVEVEALRLTHSGGSRHAGIQNLGLIVKIGRFRVIHLGDADGLTPNFDPHQIADDHLDLALVPYWYFGSMTGREIVKSLGALSVIAVHIPPGEEASVERQIEQSYPRNAFVLRPGEEWAIEWMH